MSFERLAGFTYVKQSYVSLSSTYSGEWSVSAKSRSAYGIMLLTPNPSQISPFSHPFIAFHHVVATHMTISLGVGYSRQKVEEQEDSFNLLLIAPRIGYALPLGASSHLWLRGGMTYHSLFSDDTTRRGFAISVDPSFVLSPIPHFAFTLGPTFDKDLYGQVEFEPNGEGYDNAATALGAMMGAVGYF